MASSGAVGTPAPWAGRPDKAKASWRLRAWLRRRLGEVFPAWKEVPVSHFWRGLVCFTRDMTPAIGRLEDDPSVFYGFGYQANGVNTAPWAGRALARLIAGRRNDPAAQGAVLTPLAW